MWAKKGVYYYHYFIFIDLFVRLHNQCYAIVEYKFNKTKIFKRVEEAIHSSPPPLDPPLSRRVS